MHDWNMQSHMQECMHTHAELIMPARIVLSMILCTSYDQSCSYIATTKIKGIQSVNIATYIGKLLSPCVYATDFMHAMAIYRGTNKTVDTHDFLI